MKAENLFKELGLGDDDMESAREWVNYKHFSKTVPDVLTLSEYLDTVYKKAVTLDAKPHQWFSERYMTERYLESDVTIDSKYITNLIERVDTIFESGRTLELHIQKFLELILNTVQKSKLALTKETLIVLNKIYKGK
jgi:predicted Ser/Thr protein kinase|tara:strand:+ start:1077 stop:1487 length:411 start_codon:yes stop_codon:yes gene_type:complete